MFPLEIAHSPTRKELSNEIVRRGTRDTAFWQHVLRESRALDHRAERWSVPDVRCAVATGGTSGRYESGAGWPAGRGRALLVQLRRHRLGFEM